VLPTLEGVDAVVTDIPYEISQVSGGLRDIEYGEWDGVGATSCAVEALAELNNVPSVVVFCSYWQISEVKNCFPGRSERLLAWVKPNPQIMNGQHLFLPSLDVAYYGKLQGGWFGGHCIPSIWAGPAPVNREHKTQKPEGLMCWVVSNTVPSIGTCLDPFMGSGTTGVACARLGRRFIGIEIEPKYYEIALRRIEQAQRQKDLFIHTAPAAAKTADMFKESA
jgi:site-specific DNA-methyltransferase (adenine-specific)